MSVKIVRFALILPVLFVLLASDILACACCAEPGTHFLRTAKPDKFIVDLIKEFKFANSANLYMTEAGFDGIDGLAPLQKEDESTVGVMDFGAGASFAQRVWKVSLKTPKGLTAAYSLPMPALFTHQKVDIHDVEDRPNGPWLYKEIRFGGTVASATGFARSGFVRGTKFQLIFQGRGVGCDEVEDYTHWHLSIFGPKSAYSFYGKLASGRKLEANDAE